MKVVEREGPFIKRFSGPDEESAIICFKFWQGVIASGCAGKCDYCWLQTQSPYSTGRYELTGTLFSNLPERLPAELAKWLTFPVPRALIFGENQDGLGFEHPYKRMFGVTPLEIAIPMFSDPSVNRVGHKLIVLSKFDSVDYARTFPPNPNVIFSWSVSSEWVSSHHEKGVAPLERRLTCAELMKSDGSPVRFRLDPMIPHEGWQQDYAQTIARINAIKPEMVTIGALRATNKNKLKQAAKRNKRDGSIFNILTEKDPSDFKWRIPLNQQIDLFSFAIMQVDSHVVPALCKEDETIWRAVDKCLKAKGHPGLTFRGCHCVIAGSRKDVLVQLS
ncbi:hypothetical protein MYX77_01100 [Acidobacteriia bacterium AH_259_A11_L15]|nr:hypothetical protein [Acidobacteriia bacterium AH_259_A11_L15]